MDENNENNPVLISSSCSSSSSSPTPPRIPLPASKNSKKGIIIGNKKRKHSPSASSSSAAPPRRLLIASKKKKKDKEVIIDRKCRPQVFRYPRFKSSQPPDPNRPPTCTECNREFKSLRGLYGHMRSHPERPWRGIVPPPDFSSPIPVANNNTGQLAVVNGGVEVATGLPRRSLASHPTITEDNRGMLGASPEHVNACSASSSNARFPCSVCKKVFRTYHALDGHRASHKNVKGCFANDHTAADQNSKRKGGIGNDLNENRIPVGMGCTGGCQICSRISASRQALSGHMPRQKERVEEPISAQGADENATPLALNGMMWDLNLPPPPSFVLDQSDGDSSSSPDPSLDLHL